MKFTRDNNQKHSATKAAFEQGRVCDAAGRPVTDRAVFDRLPARQMLISEQGKAVTPASCTAADSGAQARHEARKHTLTNAWKGGSK